MAIVTMKLNPGDQSTKEQLDEIKAASEKPMTYTDDAPQLTDEELAEFKPDNQKSH